MKNEIIYFSRFTLDENGGGGKRRTAQVFEMLNREVKCLFVSQSDYSYKEVKTIKLKKNLFNTKQKQLDNCFEENYLTHYNYRKKIAFLFIKKITKDTKLIFIDDPLYYESLIDFCNAEKIAVIGLVHNVESLVSGQVKPEMKKTLFHKEISIFQKCKSLITISREENLLLTNFNLYSFYLPYYPIQSIKERMLKIKGKREKTQKNGLLFLGTINNLPTRIGILNFVDKYIDGKLLKKYGKLFIGGFGAEILKKSISHPEIIIKSNLSNHDHDELLAETKACICYQEHGGGALTKIPEYLIAGIPILSNAVAARNYYNLENVILFNSKNEFYEVINTIETLDDATINYHRHSVDLEDEIIFFVKNIINA